MVNAAVRKFFVFVVVVATTCPIYSFAQTPNLPGSADTGRLEQRLYIQEQARENDIVPQEDWRVNDAVPEVLDGFILNGIELTGVSAFPEGYFTDLINEYIGRSVDLNVLNHLAARITKIYRDEGYFISRAFVPKQEVANGVVRIQIIEGYVDNVIIDDPNDLMARDWLNIGLKTISKIEALLPLHGPTLERYVLLLNDTQGLVVQSILKASQEVEKPGAVDIILQFRKRPSDTSIGYNNYGSRFVGPHQISVLHTRGRIGTAFENLNIQASSSIPANEVKFGAFEYSLPLTEEGLEASLSLSYSNSEPGLTLQPLEVEGASTTFNAGLSYPFIRSRRENLRFGGDITLRNIATEFLDQELIDDKTRSLSLFIDYNKQDEWDGFNIVRATVSKGFDILEATESGSRNLSRQQGRSDFFTAKIDATRQQNLPHDFQVIGTVSGQYAPHPLLSSQEFGYGGSALGRAYDPSEITGDQGVSASLEARYTDVPPLTAFNTTLVPFAFYDIGKVWNHDIGSEPASGASTGFGSYYAIGSHISGSVQVAYPLTREVSTPVMGGPTGPRVLLGVNVQF